MKKHLGDCKSGCQVGLNHGTKESFGNCITSNLRIIQHQRNPENSRASNNTNYA